MGSDIDTDSYVDIGTDDLKKHPCCPHGPTLLFSRQTKLGVRMFYACSACRNRKLCHFFLWTDEKYSKERRNIWELEQKQYIGEKSHEEIHATFCELKHAASRNHVVYCHTCNDIFFHDNVKEHKNHDITLNISHHQLLHPTELLKPLDCDKQEAQYLFSEASVKTLINIALENKIKSVICISAPRVHERIKSSHANMHSILLDLDRRFHLFYGPSNFCWFNLFNYHFFFGESSKQRFENFLQHYGERVLLMIDPPFGGRLEPLAHTISKIENLHKELNPQPQRKFSVILINPYFMEQRVTTCFPTFNMIDYKVTYDNHPLFSQGLKGRKLGSPVRIFSNINQKKVVLPEEEGYRFCSICDRWVSSENKHCIKCNKCTSKNGSTYWHCNKCQKCVKPSWKHCNKCKRCCLENHECSFSSVLKCNPCGEDLKKDTCTNLKDTRGFPIVNLSGNSCKRKRHTSQRKPRKKNV